MSPAATTAATAFRTGSAPGWPLVVYFHHVHARLQHYTSLTPESFVRGLDAVLARFEPVGLDDLLGSDGTLQAPERPSVLVTFDDGYADVAAALGPLAERGVPATFFVCTDLLGRRSDDPTGDHLTWADCAALRADGHSVASHGVTHRRVDELPGPEAAGEVRDSLTALRERVGVDRAAYAYPYGFVAPVPERVDGFTGPVTAFGTVKSAPRPWTEDRLAIRRTYLPTGGDDSWPEVVAGWHADWEGRG